MFIELLQHFRLYLMLKFASSNSNVVLHHHWLFVAIVHKAPSHQNEVYSYSSNLGKSDAQGLAKDETLVPDSMTALPQRFIGTVATDVG